MPCTEAPGFRMEYETIGEGEPLLLINGLGSDRSEWLFQLPAFAKRFLVIAFDNRGAGGSDVPPGPYTTAQMADDAATLLEDLGVGRAHILGVSLGGMIAQEVALRHPHRVRKLVLACTTPGGRVPCAPRPRSSGRSFIPPGPTRRRRSAGFSRFCTRRGTGGATPGEIEAFVRRRLAKPVSVEGHAAQFAAAVGHSAWDRLGSIRAPTLVVTGDADRLVPPENARRLAQRIPGANLVLLPGAPHRLFAENAEAFNREVLTFL